MALTKRSIDAATYQGNGSSWDLRYDEQVPGLALRVYPSNSKSFVLRYRTSSGRTRLLTLGRYGVLTLPEARDRARRALVNVGDGADPASDRRAAKRATAFRRFADIYLEDHAKVKKKSWRDDERRINRELLGRFGSRTLREISRADIAALHREIGARAPYEANRVLALLQVMFSLAIEWEYLTDAPNPAKGIGRFKERERDRFVTPQEMPRLAAAIEQEPNPYIRAAVWLYLLTGLRKAELLGSRWAGLDRDQRTLRIEDTKAGRPHVVPLSTAALEILDSLPRQHGSPFIFPGNRAGQPLKGFDKNWRAIRERAGLLDVRLHDLRRTTGSWLVGGGASLPLIGKVLNHSNPSTTKKYAKFADDAPRAALEEYAERLMAAAERGRENGTER